MITTGTTAEAVVNSTIALQQAMAVLSTINFWGHLNPYTGCAPNETYFDYIIVGGGTSGCVIANRLSENPNANILLIEAGRNFQLDSVQPSMLLYTRGSRIDWNFTVQHNYKESHEQNNVFTLAGKVLGGTSSVDSMEYAQGFASDYDEWAKLTKETAWEYKNVLRLFKKVERFNDNRIANSPDKKYHGFCGKVGLTKDKGPTVDKYLKMFKEVGHNTVLDINNDNRLGYTGAVYYIDGRRQNSAYAYLLPIKRRKNLVVMKDMQVTKVIFDKNKRAEAVVATATKTNTTFLFRSKQEIIIAAGTYNTPKLLQLSGIGPKNVLKGFGIETISDIPVGHNFHTRVAVPVIYALEKTSKVYVLENFNPNYFPVYSLDGFVALNKSHLNPVYHTISYTEPYTPASLMLQYTAAFYRYSPNVTNYWYQSVKDREMIFTFIEVLKPVSRGKVRIQSTDPNVPPLILGKYLSEKDDIENTLEYLKDFLKLREGNYFKKVGGFFVDPMKEKCGKYEYESDEYWRCYIRYLMTPRPHQCGTAAMGSVVDGRLRVYGVKGLRVADASIMPTIISGSPTTPTVMIGENVAEMIKQDYCKNVDKDL